MAPKSDEVRNIMALIFPHDQMDYDCHVLLSTLQNRGHQSLSAQ